MAAQRDQAPVVCAAVTVLLFHPLRACWQLSADTPFLSPGPLDSQHWCRPPGTRSNVSKSLAGASLPVMSAERHGVEANKPSSSAELWELVYAQFRQILPSRSPFGLPHFLSNAFCADHRTCCRHLLLLRVPL